MCYSIKDVTSPPKPIVGCSEFVTTKNPDYSYSSIYSYPDSNGQMKIKPQFGSDISTRSSALACKAVTKKVDPKKFEMKSKTYKYAMRNIRIKDNDV